MKTSLAFALLCASVVSCSGSQTPAPAPALSAQPAAPPVESSPAPAASPAATPDQSGIPALKVAPCSAPTECAYAVYETEGAHPCCQLCHITVGTRQWVSDVQAFCEKNPPAHCPQLQCEPLPPIKLSCEHGVCGEKR